MCQSSDGCSWISSLWSALKCPVMVFEMSVGLARGSSQPGDQTQVSRIAGEFFTAEPPGKPKNTGVGNLFLLQVDIPNPGIEPVSPALQSDYLPTETSGKLGLVKGALLRLVKRARSPENCSSSPFCEFVWSFFQFINTVHFWLFIFFHLVVWYQSPLFFIFYIVSSFFWIRFQSM